MASEQPAVSHPPVWRCSAKGRSGASVSRREMTDLYIIYNDHRLVGITRGKPE